MSGDVQPRKRKEKRRKRAEEEYHIQRIRRASLEDDDAGTPPPMLVNPVEQSMENVTLHIHKEGGTGGHWCARIIFFALFTVLIGLIGVIIFEYRGTTDVDTPVASSRWATIFEGWVDDVLPSHEEEIHSEDKHEEDHEEDEGLGSDDEGNEEEEGNDDEDDEDGDENDVSQEEGEEEEEENDDENENSPEQAQVEDEKEDEDKSENDEGFEDDEDEEDEDDEDDIGVLDEIEYEESAEADDDEEEEEEEEKEEGDADEDDIENISATDLDVSIEGVNPSSKQDEEDDELDYEFVGITGVNEIEDDSAEPLEEIEEEEPEDIINEIEIEPMIEDVTEEESTSVAVKFGVGVALVVAAHFVLVRRWNNVDTGLVAHGEHDLTRRNTIVPPGNAKQNIVTSNLSQKQQHMQELKNKYKDLQNENIQLVSNKFVSSVGSQKDIKKESDVTTASQLKKKESQEVFTSESERFSGTENESDYDYDEDELDDEEIEEEEEEEEVEEEEEEELDDSQLVAKLEAKYGKLPTPSQSEEEEEDESEEEEEEEEEEVDEKREEEIENWKRSNAPKIAHSGGTDKTKNINRPQDLTKSRQGTSAPRGGRQAADIGHMEDHNELTFQEEIEHWLTGDLDN